MDDTKSTFHSSDEDMTKTGEFLEQNLSRASDEVIRLNLFVNVLGLIFHTNYKKMLQTGHEFCFSTI